MQNSFPVPFPEVKARSSSSARDKAFGFREMIALREGLYASIRARKEETMLRHVVPPLYNAS